MNAIRRPRYKWDWSENKDGKISLAYQGIVVAHLILNTQPEYRGWYVSDTVNRFPDHGHAAVDFKSKAEGKAFLEDWAKKYATPMIEAKRLADQLKQATDNAKARQGHEKDTDRER
jgi:hypothetical protein